MSPEASETHANEAERVADQLERAFEGDAWHGPSISEILADVPAALAAARPLPAAHSILEIVLHMTAWQRTVRERLEGKPLQALPDDENWPRRAELSESDWAEVVCELRKEYELLRSHALNWSGRDLGGTTEGGRYTVYEMLHGIVQHSLYHAGQIALLKKAVGETPR